MELKLPGGKYILAVSGGVDSMVLLDVLAKKAGLELVVAHFDHGIRPRSETVKEERLVATAAKQWELKFEVGQAELGAGASEDEARVARYEFLEGLRSKYKAKAIITAHHQDDLIETALINIVRGTGWRGLAAIAINPGIIRPLLELPKAELLKYAKKHKLSWIEDSTNTDTMYLRNYLRKMLLPELSTKDRRALITNIQKVVDNQAGLIKLIATVSRKVENRGVIDRQKFNVLPTEIAGELVAYWLRQRDIEGYDRKTVDGVIIALKTARAGTCINIKGNYSLILGQNTAQINNTL